MPRSPMVLAVLLALSLSHPAALAQRQTPVASPALAECYDWVRRAGQRPC